MVPPTGTVYVPAPVPTVTPLTDTLVMVPPVITTCTVRSAGLVIATVEAGIAGHVHTHVGVATVYAIEIVCPAGTVYVPAATPTVTALTETLVIVAPFAAMITVADTCATFVAVTVVAGTAGCAYATPIPHCGSCIVIYEPNLPADSPVTSRAMTTGCLS